MAITYRPTLAEIVLDLFQALPKRERVLVGKRIVDEMRYKSWDALTLSFRKFAQEKNLSEKDVLKVVFKDRYGEAS